MKGEEKGWGIGTCRELLKITLKGRKEGNKRWRRMCAKEQIKVELLEQKRERN